MSFDEGISDGRFPFHDAHREDRHPPIPRDIAQTIGKIAFPLENARLWGSTFEFNSG